MVLGFRLAVLCLVSSNNIAWRGASGAFLEEALAEEAAAPGSCGRGVRAIDIAILRVELLPGWQAEN